MEHRKKIFIIFLPDIGHINPLFGTAKILVDQNHQVVFYGRLTQKEIIEKTGSEFRRFRAYGDESNKIPSLLVEPKLNFFAFMEYLIDITYGEISGLMNDILREKPDLVVYDHFSLPAKLTLKVIESRHKKGLVEWTPNKVIKFYTCFANLKNVYPLGKNDTILETGFKAKWSVFRLFIKQVIFSFRHGINVYDTMDFVFDQNEDLNLVSVFPELQPYVDRFDSSFKFVGSCIGEEIRKSHQCPQINKILYLFEPKNPRYEHISTSSNKFKLIYCSFGTLFNNNLFLYEYIIEAIKSLNEDLNFIKIIFSLGKASYENFSRRIAEENYKITENIILLPFAPQIEILERADLFITHCGMNSASEAIHFGVPMIGIPICADQPLVSDWLMRVHKFGIQFKPFEVNTVLLKKAILEVINNQEYSNNILMYSKISRNYKGCKESARLFMEYIQ